MVTKAYFLFCFWSSIAAVCNNLAPVIPNGCPMAIAPPFGLILGSLSSKFMALVQAKL